MDNCTRHAFTDGECVLTGCKDCPGRQTVPRDPTLVLDRLIAIAAIVFFGGCLAVGVSLIVDGLNRAERAYQLEART